MGQRTVITATKEQLAAAFTEWDRRHRENPEAFLPDGKTTEGYGEGCADYFVSLLVDLGLPDVTDRPADPAAITA